MSTPSTLPQAGERPTRDDGRSRQKPNVSLEHISSSRMLLRPVPCLARRQSSRNDEIVNIRIRPYELADAVLVFEAARESLPALRPWMPWCHPDYSIEESRSWLETQVAAFENRAAFEFAIVAADGRYLGACGLNQIDTANQRANLGYWVRSSAAGCGVATAAVRLLRDWGFCNTELVRLEIVVAVGNGASHRVAEKAGAVREGTLRSRLLLHGISHDATMYSFTRGT
jgi:ribosomal-protein-serine acetyltransferase